MTRVPLGVFIGVSLSGSLVTPPTAAQDSEQCLQHSCNLGEVCRTFSYDRDPYLQQLTSTSVIVVTESVEPTTAHIAWHPSEASGSPQSLIRDVPSHNHEFVLTGLEPATSYSYVITHDADGRTTSATFRTVPLSGGTVEVAVFGDSGLFGPEQDGVIDLVAAMEPHLILHTGDMAYGRGFSCSYQLQLFTPFAEVLARSALFPSPGNHDCDPFDCNKCWLYTDDFVLPTHNPLGDELTYSFDAGDAHFVSIDSNCSNDKTVILDWIRQDLRASDKIWKIVYFHHPIYTIKDSHGPDTSGTSNLRDIINSEEVDIVFNGHEHMYERTHPIRDGEVVDAFHSPTFVRPRGTIFVVTGGGGRLNIPDEIETDPHRHFIHTQHSRHHMVSMTITPTRIDLQATDISDTLLDRFSILKEEDTSRPEFGFFIGDANGSGNISFTDATRILKFLFLGVGELCTPTSDPDGSELTDLTDAIILLRFVILGGVPEEFGIGECRRGDESEAAGCFATCTTS